MTRPIRASAWTKVPLGLIGGLLFISACNLFAPSPAGPPIPLPRTPVPTWTLPFRLTSLPTPTPFIPGPTNTLVIRTETPTPTETPIPSPSPTARPGIDPTLGATTPDPFITPEFPIPEPVPQLRLDEDIVNILLLGRDTARESRSYRTDVIIVASVNKKAKSVTMLTIPRDLFVYVPGWTMNRINTAAGHGDAIGYPGGGVALLEQTILYNLGLPIHGWARVDFTGFQNVVDVLGGVDVPVTCRTTEWKLKDHSLPLTDDNPDDWELYTLEPGVHHLDGYMALWYARSRKRSSDFDRSRRQHQVLRALFAKALQLNVIPKLPELYAQYIQIVDTDLGLGEILQFAPMAATLDRSHIKSRFIGSSHVYGWTTSQGARVLLPDREAIANLLDEAFLPPSQNVLARAAPVVEVWNGTPHQDWAALAAENLEWSGIRPVFGQADAANYPATLIYDFTTSPKGSARRELQRIFKVDDAHVISQPDGSAPYPFRVVLGANFESCLSPITYARPAPTPGPSTAVPESEKIVHAAAVLAPPPKIDGDLAEWTFLVYPVNEISHGGENRRDQNDIYAEWNIAWDEDFLYIAAKIKDDVLVPPPPGENLFKGDSLEIWLNVDPGRRTAQLTTLDFQLGISPGNIGSPTPKAEAYLWQPKSLANNVRDVVVGAKRAEGGLHLELAIPWSIFRVIPFAGEGFGFALALNDNDTPSRAAQETQVTNIKDAKLTDPTTWGILVLDPPPNPAR